jgi:hypothetical protein
LGFVPVDEVLRMLTRSHQQGSVSVTGGGVRGRIFVGRSGVDLATTFNDDELHRHLVNSRCADGEALDRVTSGEINLPAIAEGNTALIDLLREMTVESLYQIAERGREFEVEEHVTTPYASPEPFDLEDLLRDADERRKEWETVSDVITDLNDVIAFRRDLAGREEVTVKADDWKVLSEIGRGSSVQDIAEHLGTTEFWAARVSARLVTDELLVLGASTATRLEPDEEPGGPVDTVPTHEQTEVQSPAPTEASREEEQAASHAPPEPAVEQTAWQTPEEPVEEQTAWQAPADPVQEQNREDHAPATDEDDGDGGDSWWREPSDENDHSTPEDAEWKTPEVVSEDLSEMPSVGLGDEDEDGEEDTEAFLEKVFSELESSDDPESSDDSEEPDSEPEEGHGLLRRRRMGTLRDFSSDS